MSRKGWMTFAVVGALLLGSATFWLLAAMALQSPHASPVTTPSHPASATTTQATFAFQPYASWQVNEFLMKAKEVEAIKDPLQRCLAYPDPPDSHWNADAVKAYCRYRNLPVMSFDEVRHLIESGHAAELDRRLADALHKQFTDPASQGLLDHIYQNVFDNGSFDIRPLLDAWKRQSPDSAFAYAASGMAYADMATAARGSDYIRNTPEDAILSMDRLASEADIDLRHAIALEPRMTPAYAAMMDIGRMTLGRQYALQARDAGLKVAPDNFFLYSAASLMAEPKWGGEADELETLRHRELEHAAQNPLLYLAATVVKLREFDFFSCDCDTPQEQAQVMQTLQDVSSAAALGGAGNRAESAKQPGLAAVYYTEALRFADVPEFRLSRAFDLVKVGYPAWAHDELTAVAPALPGRGDVYRGMGYADLELEKDTRAIGELEQAVRIEDTDTWSWESLGTLYARARQWDKAWSVADQLVRLEPDAPDGWRLRAQVQMEQPRAGLADTERAFAKRFGNRPDEQATLKQMRDALAHAKH